MGKVTAVIGQRLPACARKYMKKQDKQSDRQGAREWIRGLFPKLPGDDA